MTKLVRVKDETHTGLSALTQYGSNMDETIQKLIRFYLAKHTDSVKDTKVKNK